MLRSALALLLFLRVCLSYGAQWLLSRATLRRGFQARWERLHVSNARRLARGFVRLRGVYIKLGQVISVLGTFLPEAYGEALRELQDAVPPRPFAELQTRLVAAWGTAGLERFESFDETPLAAASLAQVHRARTRSGRDVAVKILYPGIERLVASDLFVIRLAFSVLYKVFGFRRMGGVAEQLHRMLDHEMDYTHERHNVELVRGILGQRQDVVIPEVVAELSTASVLVLSLETGARITDKPALAAQGNDVDKIATTLVDCYLSMLLQHRVLHADPHPGNFLVKPDNRLVILDYGAVEPISENLVSGIKTVIFGGLSRNATMVLQGVEQMGFVAEGGDRSLLEQVGREYLRSLSELQVQDFSSISAEELLKMSGASQLRGRLRGIAGSVQYPDNYFYVERTLVLLFGLVGQLAPAKGLFGIAAPLATKALLRSFPAAPQR